jgi:hypothetical protein
MKAFLQLTVAMVVLVVAGCRKNPLNNLTEEEQRIYITNYDKTTRFNTFTSFSISDRITVVDNNNSRQQLTPADQALIQSLSRGLQSRGFRTATSATTADLGVQVSRIVRTTTGFVTGPDYWGMWDPGYWGYNSWGSGFGGGWGPGFTTVMPYEVREGMLAIDIIDLKSSSGNPRIVWNALVRGPGLASPATVDNIVENLLKQSPYLQTN